MKGFKEFIMRGNLVELAVAFIIATAFAAVVTAFAVWIMSLIPAGATDFGNTPFGLFIAALVSFVIIAAVVYFAVVTPYTKLQERRAAGKEEEPAPLSAEEMLLQEIRDLLAAQKGTGSSTGQI